MRWILFILICIGNICLAAQFSVSLHYNYLDQLKYLFLGMSAYLIIYHVFLKGRSNHQFLSVLSHELNHTLVSLLFGYRVSEIYATESNGGYMTHHGKAKNTLVILSPYCLPIVFILLLMLNNFINGEMRPAYEAILGIILSFYWITFWKQAGGYQSDFQKMGINFSYAFIIATNLFVMECSIIIISFGWNSLDDAFIYGLKIVINHFE